MAIANLWSKASSVLSSAIHRAYDVDQDAVASAGLWKIYNAKKKSSNQKVSVFVFEKKLLDNPMQRAANLKGVHERLFETMKKEASQLARLRHPSILEIVEPVEETRTIITFATEPLLASLSNLLGNYEYLSNVPSEVRKFELDDLEFQKGFLQIGKALQFCHEAGKLVHSNLQPDAIFVNIKGDWKMGGFGFSQYVSPPGGGKPIYEYPEYDNRIPAPSQKNFDYMAPEFALDESIEVSSDMFSLGCLIYAVHNKGVPPFQNRQNLHTYRKNVEKLTSISYNHLPGHLHDVMYRLLTRYPSGRMNASEFITSKYFDNVLVSTIRFLESFPEKSRHEKSDFLKGVVRVLPQFPNRILLRKILPSLLEECKESALLPFIIPNIFHIVNIMSIEEFQARVLPTLKPIFQVKEPPQNLITLLDKIDLLKEKTSAVVFKEDVMPLVYSALETNTPTIQEKALRTVPGIAETLDYVTVKNSLFPRVLTLFSHTTILSVKVNTLICFHSLMKTLDKFTIVEKVVPALKGIKTKEPAVMVASLAVYEEMGKVLDKEGIAEHILPQLWSMSMGPLLNLEQFKRFMKVIHDLGNLVEQQHSQHLQELKRIEDHTTSYTQNGSAPSTTTSTGDAAFDFERLVSGGSVPNGGKQIASDPFDALVGSSNSSRTDLIASSSPTPTVTTSHTRTATAPMKLTPSKPSFGAVSNVNGWLFDTSNTTSSAPTTPALGSTIMTPLSNKPTNSTSQLNPALRPLNNVPALAPPPLKPSSPFQSASSTPSFPNYNLQSMTPTTSSTPPPLFPQQQTNGANPPTAQSSFGLMQPLRPASSGGQLPSNLRKPNSTAFNDFDPLN